MSRPDLDRGFFVQPTVIADCTVDMKVAQEEIFGPVVVAIPFDDEEEGIALANATDFGLYDYVWSGDTAQALRVAQRLRCGNVGINTAQPQPRDAVRRVQEERRRSRRRLLRPARVQRAAEHRLARLAP